MLNLESIVAGGHQIFIDRPLIRVAFNIVRQNVNGLQIIGTALAQGQGDRIAIAATPGNVVGIASSHDSGDGRESDLGLGEGDSEQRGAGEGETGEQHVCCVYVTGVALALIRLQLHRRRTCVMIKRSIHCWRATSRNETVSKGQRRRDRSAREEGE